MEAEKNSAERWVDGAGNFVETYRELLTVRMVEHASLGASISALGIISLIFSLCILLFVGLGSAWWIGESMNNTKAGFFIVGGVYFVLLAIVLATARKFIIPLIRNLIIKKVYEQN